MSPQQFTQLQYLINYQGNLIMTTLADLQTQVAANARATDAVLTLLTDLKTKLAAAVTAADPVALQAVSDELAAATAKLEGALTADPQT